MAMPEPGYDTTSALVVTDVQNDFASPGGSLYVAGGEEVVPVVNREIERALEAGAFGVSRDALRAVDPHPGEGARARAEVEAGGGRVLWLAGRPAASGTSGRDRHQGQALRPDPLDDPGEGGDRGRTVPAPVVQDHDRA